MSLENKFIILTAFYNSEDYIAKSIKGTLKQGHSDLGVIFINDASTDESKSILFDQITGFSNFSGSINQSGSSNIWTGEANGKDIIYIENATRIDCAALNQKIAVDKYVSNTGSICGIVDGDDFLHDSNTANWVTREMGQDKLMYASTQKWVSADKESERDFYSNKPLTQSDFPDFVVDGVTYPGHTPTHIRCQGWTLNHFRAFKKVLSDNINTGQSFYNPTGALIKAASDVAYFLPMQDMAGADRVKISKASHYTYNYENPINDHTTRQIEQQRNSKFCMFGISGVEFIDGTGDAEDVSLRYNYNIKTDENGNKEYTILEDANVSGVVDGVTGYFAWIYKPENGDGSVSCVTPYNYLNL